MTAIAAKRTPLLPGRPVRQFNEQLLFLALSTAGYALAILAITIGVAQVRPIEASGWALAHQPMRWFGFAIGCYLAYSVLPLHVLHGQTRRHFLIRLAAFIPVYAGLVAVLIALVFYIEAALYGLVGWPQAIPPDRLFTSPFESHLVVLETWLVFGLWTSTGIMIAAGWYRSGVLGAVLLPVGLILASFSAIALGLEDIPFDWVGRLVPTGPVSLPNVVLVHLGAILFTGGVTWAIARDVPIRSKTASA